VVCYLRWTTLKHPCDCVKSKQLCNFAKSFLLRVQFCWQNKNRGALRKCLLISIMIKWNELQFSLIRTFYVVAFLPRSSSRFLHHISIITRSFIKSNGWNYTNHHVHANFLRRQSAEIHLVKWKVILIYKSFIDERKLRSKVLRLIKFYYWNNFSISHWNTETKIIVKFLKQLLEFLLCNIKRGNFFIQ
jgi:hypothetical protein